MYSVRWRVSSIVMHWLRIDKKYFFLWHMFWDKNFFNNKSKREKKRVRGRSHISLLHEDYVIHCHWDKFHDINECREKSKQNVSRSDNKCSKSRRILYFEMKNEELTFDYFSLDVKVKVQCPNEYLIPDIPIVLIFTCECLNFKMYVHVFKMCIYFLC